MRPVGAGLLQREDSSRTSTIIQDDNLTPLQRQQLNLYNELLMFRMLS